jgi:hypothetical protein
MALHKFKVGQLVDYTPPSQGLRASSREYKVLRLLPSEGPDLQYRIKSVAENFERVAKEHELSRRNSS